MRIHHARAEHYRDLARVLAGLPADLSNIPGKDLERLAIFNGAAPLLDYRREKGNATGIGEKVAAVLREQARNQAARDLALNHDTRQLLERLSGAGLKCIALKGTPLALLHYPQPYLRERCDTDIYIAPGKIAEVVAVLREGGYGIHGLGARPQASKQFQATARSRQPLQSTFDIHHRLSNRVFFQNTLPIEECWRERQPVPALGPDAWSLSNRDLLLHACIHRIAHGRGTERNRLIWLYDIHLLWNAMSETERSAFIEKALDKKIGAVCADALMVSEELFGPGASRTSVSYDELLKNEAREPTARLVNAGKLRWAWADYRAIEGLRNKLAFAVEIAFRK